MILDRKGSLNFFTVDSMWFKITHEIRQRPKKWGKVTKQTFKDSVLVWRCNNIEISYKIHTMTFVEGTTKIKSHKGTDKSE